MENANPKLGHVVLSTQRGKATIRKTEDSPIIATVSLAINDRCIISLEPNADYILDTTIGNSRHTGKPIKGNQLLALCDPRCECNHCIEAGKKKTRTFTGNKEFNEVNLFQILPISFDIADLVSGIRIIVEPLSYENGTRIYSLKINTENGFPEDKDIGLSNLTSKELLVELSALLDNFPAPGNFKPYKK